MSNSLQSPPQSDSRYRVHRSVKCYLADIACGTAGCTLYFSESIERVVYLFPGKIEKVQYRNKFYALQSPEKMNALVASQLRTGGAVHVGGKYVERHEVDQDFVAYPFIEISSPKDGASYERLSKVSNGNSAQGDA